MLKSTTHGRHETNDITPRIIRHEHASGRGKRHAKSF